MNKLSLDALKQRAEAVASEDVLATISGGLENSCHDAPRSLEQDVKNLPSTPTVSVPNPPAPGNTSGTIRINF
ncbi:hypothetical protein [Chryseobacterium sp.]|uniref:hypothetical protein n=1 Tax=Chryseobacterium sp. TaxID=1871047 RepID=UPI002FC9F2DB